MSSTCGGQATATFFSLIDSARRADLNPWDYDTDLLTRLPSHPINQLDGLLPDNWQLNGNRTAASANWMGEAVYDRGHG